MEWVVPEIHVRLEDIPEELIVERLYYAPLYHLKLNEDYTLSFEAKTSARLNYNICIEGRLGNFIPVVNYENSDIEVPIELQMDLIVDTLLDLRLDKQKFVDSFQGLESCLMDEKPDYIEEYRSFTQPMLEHYMNKNKSDWFKRIRGAESYLANDGIKFLDKLLGVLSRDQLLQLVTDKREDLSEASEEDIVYHLKLEELLRFNESYRQAQHGINNIVRTQGDARFYHYIQPNRD